MRLPVALSLSVSLLLTTMPSYSASLAADAGDDAGQPTVGPAGMAAPPTISGPEAASELKGWYDDTSANCGGAGRPGLLCSGVLFRATGDSGASLPWDPAADAIVRGGQSFSWIRSDHNFATALNDRPNGYIFYPTFKIPEGKLNNIKALCAFPRGATTNSRTEQGCGTLNAAPATRPCVSQGINTADDWLKSYLPGDSVNICGWNIREGAGNTATWFSAAVAAHQGLPESGAWRGFNEVIMSAWKAGEGATLPIHSFFYISGKPDGLTNARRDQTRYHDAFGQVIPIVKITLPTTKAGKAAFAYSKDDQAVNPDTPDTQLRTWYEKTSANCGGTGQIAVLCSGVLFRATGDSGTSLPWDPSADAITRGGQSFSWIRTDHNFATPLNDRPNGYIFYPTFEVPEGKLNNIEVLCIFPRGANTNSRTEQGCGTLNANIDTRPCAAQGINTANEWLSKYLPATSANVCGWNVRRGAGGTAAWFTAAIGAHQGLPEAGAWRGFNEVIMAAWKAGEGAKLPIHSFFYLSGSTAGLSSAKRDQTRYHDAFGQIVPIVKVTLPTTKAGKATFAYAPADQAVK